MNWYILYVLCGNEARIVKLLNQVEGLHAFVPMMEYYRRDQQANAFKVMFPGYVFVKSGVEPIEFHNMLASVRLRHQKMMKELMYEEATSLKPEEARYFEKLLDEDGLMRMSVGVIEGKRLRIIEGPLRYFEENIVKVDKHERMAYLDLEFMKRRVKAAFCLWKDAEKQ